MNQLAVFQRATHTFSNHDCDFTAWHRGRNAYYFWAVMIVDSDWCAAADAAANWLEPYLVPGYRRQPHVTIVPAGFSSLTSSQRDQATALARQINVFELGLGALTSFTASPYFGVEKGNLNLDRLRTGLRTVLVDIDYTVTASDYIPHLTVGLYRDRFETSVIARRLRAFSGCRVPDLVVDRFALCRYATSSIKGAIETVEEFRLS